MVSSHSHSRIWRSAAIAVCAVVIGGCAGLPRIDPTGERVFIWPQQRAQPVVPTIGNAQVAPVFTDPVFPQPTLSPVIGATTVGLPPVPQDTLSITPQRVLAPVGSEVILKAGLCTREQFLLTDARVNWLIARESAGEFVSLGGRGWLQKPWLPWNQPKKIDNQYATGYTARVPLLITRGTQDVSDDVQVEPGEAWASITSAVEGTSHITAVAPEIETWSQRRATATIYWIDVQWSFPPTSMTSGGSQVLTTTLRRQTDGTPLEGWIVQYEVAGGGGSLRGSASDQVVEVRTDTTGTASIEVTPTGEGGNTTQINIQLVRPERYRDSDAPRLVVSKSTTTISWSGSGTPYLPPPDDLGGFPPSTFPTTPQQPALPAVDRKPVLEIEIFGGAEARVGDVANFEVVIKNVGNGEATGVELSDRFDRGFSHAGDTLGSQEISKAISRTIAGGTSIRENIQLRVLQAGNLCHVVTVNCREGAQAQKQTCVNVIQPLPQIQASMTVEKSGPRSRTVNEVAPFTLVVTNTGEVPLTQLEILDEYPTSLRATPSESGYEKINQGDGRDRFLWRIPRLEVGASKRIEVQCQCVAQTPQSCSTVQVSAVTGTAVGTISRADEHCFEIRPLRDVVPGNAGGANVVPSVTPGGGTLAVGITAFADPVRAGQRATYQIVVANKSSIPDEQVKLIVTFPPELTPDISSITNASVQLLGNQLHFQSVAQIQAGEKLDFLITVSVTQQGVRNIIAEVTSRNVTTPIKDVKSVTILGR